MALAVGLSSGVSAGASRDIPLEKKWLHVYAPEGVTEFTAIPYDSISGFSLVPDLRASEESNDTVWYNELRVNLKNGAGPVCIPMSGIDRFDISSDLPVIDITLTDYPEAPELWNKELYLDATVNIDGAGEYEDVIGWETKIKGRGNTTWGWSKKPYRFKASKKISLLGMKKAKSYALIANYIDSSHMRNFVSLRLASMLGMPFSNSCVPVRVRFNGNDKGLYFLTEKIGIGGASVDIDEETGWMFELDSAMDEKYSYESEPYSLPVMVKDPDLDEIYPDAPEAQWEKMQADFNGVLGALKDCKDESWRDLIDAESLVKYLIVFNFAHNMELRHPKSVYIYKGSPEDKYHFGPVWDFDWSFHFNTRGEYTREPGFPLLHPSDTLLGGKFFYKLTQLPGMKEELVAKWDEMVETIYPRLLEEMDAYAEKIRPAAKSDGLIWAEKPEVNVAQSFEFDSNYQKLRSWIERRVAAAAEHPARLFYYVPGYGTGYIW